MSVKFHIDGSAISPDYEHSFDFMGTKALQAQSWPNLKPASLAPNSWPSLSLMALKELLVLKPYSGPFNPSTGILFLKYISMAPIEMFPPMFQEGKLMALIFSLNCNSAWLSL